LKGGKKGKRVTDSLNKERKKRGDREKPLEAQLPKSRWGKGKSRYRSPQKVLKD